MSWISVPPLPCTCATASSTLYLPLQPTNVAKKMAIQHFHPPTKLSVPNDERAALLYDPTFVSSIEELECQDFMHIEYLKANTSWTSLESLYLKHYTVRNNTDNSILKSLLPQLKILHIRPTHWSQSDFEKIIDMFLTAPSPKKQDLRLYSPFQRIVQLHQFLNFSRTREDA